MAELDAIGEFAVSAITCPSSLIFEWPVKAKIDR